MKGYWINGLCLSPCFVRSATDGRSCFHNPKCVFGFWDYPVFRSWFSWVSFFFFFSFLLSWFLIGWFCLVVFAAIGFNVETVQYKNIKFQVWDLGMYVDLCWYLFQLPLIWLLLYCPTKPRKWAGNFESKTRTYVWRNEFVKFSFQLCYVYLNSFGQFNGVESEEKSFF